MQLKKIALFSTALLGFSIAQAHNVWFESVQGEANQYVLKFGHEETETYPESKVTAIRTADSKGDIKNAHFQYKNGEAFVTAPNSSILFAQFNNGVWSKLPSGRYVEKTKKQEPTAVSSINPIKYGKAILQWNAQAYKPQNMTYELVPQSEAKAGEPLAILVLHEGKPVQGIKVGEGEDKPFNLTNDKGIATFTPHKGYNKVWAEFEEPVKDKSEYDSRSIEYMLTFDAK